LRVVFDTNIYISAFAIPGSSAEQAYRPAISGSFKLFTSIAILTELANTLRSKFDWSEEKTRQLLRSLANVATVLKTQPHLHVLRDEADNRILECAHLARADAIVTGDRHLLSLGLFEDIPIIKLVDFLARLKSLDR
jgi:putative PIN family toxin of toxin-antitoxin system